MKIPFQLQILTIGIGLLSQGYCSYPYDMASLAYMSDYIVSTETRQSDAPPLCSFPPPTEILIKDVFKGELGPGTKLTVENYHLLFQVAEDKKAKIGDFQKVYLFLQKVAHLANPCVVSYRLITTEDVWRPKEFENPGPDYLWPCENEFIRPDLENWRLIPRTLVKDYFEYDLSEAIKRAEIFEKAENERDVEKLKLFIHPHERFPYDFWDKLSEMAHTNLYVIKHGYRLIRKSKEDVIIDESPPKGDQNEAPSR